MKCEIIKSTLYWSCPGCYLPNSSSILKLLVFASSICSYDQRIIVTGQNELMDKRIDPYRWIGRRIITGSSTKHCHLLQFYLTFIWKSSPCSLQEHQKIFLFRFEKRSKISNTEKKHAIIAIKCVTDFNFKKISKNNELVDF